MQQHTVSTTRRTAPSGLHPVNGMSLGLHEETNTNQITQQKAILTITIWKRLQTYEETTNCSTYFVKALPRSNLQPGHLCIIQLWLILAEKLAEVSLFLDQFRERKLVRKQADIEVQTRTVRQSVTTLIKVKHYSNVLVDSGHNLPERQSLLKSFFLNLLIKHVAFLISIARLHNSRMLQTMYLPDCFHNLRPVIWPLTVNQDVKAPKDEEVKYVP